MTRTPPRYTIMLGTGQHNAWRLLPRGQRYLESFDHYLSVAQESERAGIHGLLLADSLTQDQARQVPRNLPHPQDRYARAREFTEVLHKLWTSWDENAVIADVETGVYFEPESVSPINHRGPHFSVDGPLNLPRSPQGSPAIGSAGSSDLGRAFAAEFADFVYAAQPSKRIAGDYFNDLRTKAHHARSDGSRPTVLTGVIPIIAETRSEAKALAARLREPTDFDSGRRRVEQLLGGADLGGLSRRDRIDPAIIPPPDDIIRRQGRYEIFKSLAVEEGHTLEELVDVVTNTSGHWTVVGTVDDVVAAFAERFDSELTDGFNIWPTHYPEGLTTITQRLLPALERAGYFTPLPDEPTTFRDLFTTWDPAPILSSGAP